MSSLHCSPATRPSMVTAAARAPAPHPVYGRDQVARLLLGLFRIAHRLGVQLRPAEVNGQPGARCLDPAGGLINVLSLDISDGAVQVIRSIMNTDKLRHLGPLSPIGRRNGV